MKASAIITFIFLSFISISQNQIIGTWLLPDNNNNTPVGVDFKANGEFTIFDIHQSPAKAFSTIEGYYHFEGNSLVTITWEGPEIVTSRFQYAFKNGNLVLEETYPNKERLVFQKETEVADL